MRNEIMCGPENRVFFETLKEARKEAKCLGGTFRKVDGGYLVMGNIEAWFYDHEDKKGYDRH